MTEETADTTADTASTAEKVFGRRFRPWWGKSPWNLITAGIFQGVILGALAYASLDVITENYSLIDEIDASDRDLAVQIATIALIVLAVGLVYCVARVLAGILELTSRTGVEGTLLDAQKRYFGDFLPGPIQQIRRMRRRQRRRRDGRYHHQHRRTTPTLVIDTPKGPKSWVVRNKLYQPELVGGRVRLTAGRFLGYVTKIEVLEPPPRPETPQGDGTQIPGMPDLSKLPGMLEEMTKTWRLDN